MTGTQIALLIAGIIVLGIVIFPLINRAQFRRLSYEQQVRIIMKQAKGLIYFKNLSSGTHGKLYYVKNKRKILVFNWILFDGKMLVTDKNPFERWSYPEERERLNSDELTQLFEELEKFNKKSAVKLVFENEIQGEV